MSGSTGISVDLSVVLSLVSSVDVSVVKSIGM